MESDITKPTEFDKDTSRSITSLRFLLMVFVVFIHHGVTSFRDADGNEIFYEIPIIADKIIYFVTQILTRCAVPLFFFISGYILIKKNDDYKTMLKKRVKTLLTPYFLWPIFYIILYSLLRLLPFLQSFINKPENPYLNKSFFEWLEVFFGHFYLTKGNKMPELVFQFWYLRDLMILFLISPVLKKGLEKFPFGILCLVTCLRFFDSEFHLIVASNGLFFFVLGMYAAKVGFTVNHLEKISFLELGILLSITLTANMILAHFEKSVKVVQGLNIIELSILFLKLANRWQKNEKVFSVLKYLSGFSFWLFALHAPLINGFIRRIYEKLFPKEGYFILVEFFTVVIVTVGVCLVLGILVKKIIPKIFALFTGGR